MELHGVLADGEGIMEVWVQLLEGEAEPSAEDRNNGATLQFGQETVVAEFRVVVGKHDLSGRFFQSMSRHLWLLGIVVTL
jgi:hypothetical protein